MLNKREFFYCLFFLILGVLFLVFFPIIDLEFSQSVYAYQVWADWLLKIMLIPGFLAAFLFAVELSVFAILGNIQKKENTTSAFHMILGFLSILFLPIFGFWRIMTYFGGTIDVTGWIMVFVIILFSLLASYFKNRDISAKARKIKEIRCSTGLLLFYALSLATLFASSLLGRVPYKTLLSVGSTEYFMPWFRTSGSDLLSVLSGGKISFGCSPCAEVVFAGMIMLYNYRQDGSRRGLRNFLMVFAFLNSMFAGILCLMNGLCYVTDVVLSIMLSGLFVGAAGLILRWVHPEGYGNLYERLPGLE